MKMNVSGITAASACDRAASEQSTRPAAEDCAKCFGASGLSFLWKRTMLVRADRLRGGI